MPQYLVEMYVPSSAVDQLTDGARRIRVASGDLRRAGVAVRLLRVVAVPVEETWFLLFEAESAAAVQDTVARAAMPGGRVVPASVVSH